MGIFRKVFMNAAGVREEPRKGSYEWKKEHLTPEQLSRTMNNEGRYSGKKLPAVEDLLCRLKYTATKTLQFVTELQDPLLREVRLRMLRRLDGQHRHGRKSCCAEKDFEVQPNEVFKCGLGRYFKLLLKDNAVPVFMKKPPVPCVSAPDLDAEIDRPQQEHRHNLEALFGRIHEYGFRVRLEKCNFLMAQIRYLGYIIDKDGRHPDPEKIEVIRQIPVPKNVAEQITDSMICALEAAAYLDDVIGRTQKEHRRNLEALFGRIPEYGFCVRLEKCNFLMTREDEVKMPVRLWQRVAHSLI
ncbi:hypothetical protein RB195_018380 [Necator americanus]|uniref:Reverse transcriptase domain-containing protein n=1 Tax=Necator americanus TaxID=51031 RepID=A0ABR1CBT6_NECAM